MDAHRSKPGESGGERPSCGRAAGARAHPADAVGGRSGERPWRRRARRLGAIAWAAAVAAAAGLLIQPVNSRGTRWALLAALAAAWAGPLLLWWRRPAVRVAMGVPLLAAVLLFTLPGRPVDREELRRAYVEALLRYEGTAYVYGGEGRAGIDCSGLPRAAMIEADCSLGLRRMDAGLLREALSIWWHDRGAGAMGEDGDPNAVVVRREGPLSAVAGELAAGDIGVIRGNTHVIAHVGGDRWIEADPEPMRVVIRPRPPGEPLAIRLVRWRQLADAGRP
jgi:hypothetical protein